MARIIRMDRMRARSRGTGPRTTVARAARLLNRSARACPSHASQKPLRLIKVLSDLSIVVPADVYRHSGPSGPGVHPANPAHPGHPASDKKSARERKPPRAIHASAVSNRAYAGYFACLTSPNVFNARCAGETGPRNRRVTNVAALPPNETSSIW